MLSINCKTMEIMHSILVSETTKLQQNISTLKDYCARMEHIITALDMANGDAEEGVEVKKAPSNFFSRRNNNEMLGMVVFDQYMEQMSNTINLARMLNKHLQLSHEVGLINEDAEIFQEMCPIGANSCKQNVEANRSQRDCLRSPNHIENTKITDKSTYESELGICKPSTVQFDLTSYVKNYEFHAEIIHVEDSHLLTFHVRNRERNKTTLQLSKTLNLGPDGGISPGLKLYSLLCEPRKLFHTPERFQLVPPDAIKCRLVSVHGSGCATSVPSDSERALLESVLERNAHKEVHLKVLRNDGDLLYVHLLEDHPSGSLLEPMITSKPTLWPKPNLNPFVDTSINNLRYFNTDVPDLPLSVFAVDSYKTNVSTHRILHASVTFIRGVTTFYAQTQELGIIEKKSSLYWRQCELPLNSFLQHAPHIGDLVLAEYAEDKQFYRAKVLKVVSDSILQVFFVDYGNIEEVLLSRMAKCAIQKEDEPFHAVYCCMADIIDATAGDLKKHQEAIDFVDMYFSKRSFKIEVLKEHMDNDSLELLVRIIDEFLGDLPELLIEMGYAKEI